MEKKFVYGIAGLVLVCVLVVLANFVWNLFNLSDSLVYPETIKAEDKACEVDLDCRLVYLGCCDGSSQSVSLNETSAQKVSDWKQQNCSPCKMYTDTSTYFKVSVKPVCQENQCEIKYVPYCESIVINCTVDLRQEDLDKLNMTKEEVLAYCGC